MKYFKAYAIAATLWGILLATTGLAGEFFAKVDRNQGQVGDEFILTYVIRGSYSGEPMPQPIPGISMRTGGSSSSISIINGNYDKKVEVTYYLVPEKPGTFTIPPISLKVDGEMLTTEALTINVAKSGSVQAPDGEASALFLERSLSKQRVYINEPIISTIKLYSRVQLSGGTPEIDVPSHLKAIPIEGEKNYRTRIKGVEYNVIELNRIYIPLKVGKIELPPFKIKAAYVVRQPNSQSNRVDPFGFFNRSFGRTVNKLLMTEPAEIDIMPLPDQGKPGEFSGLVGQFSLKADLSPKNLEVGETSTLTVFIEGWGHTDGFVLKNPVDIPGLKIYEDKPEYEARYSAEEGVFSKASFKFALVPTKSGKVDIGSLNLSVFDPVANEYQSLKAALGALEIKPSTQERQALQQLKGSADSTTSDSQKSSIDQLGQDLIDLKRNVTKMSSEHGFNTKVALNALLYLLIPLFAFLYFGFREISPGKSKKSDLQKKKKNAFEKFMEEKKLIESGQARGDHFDQLSEAFRNYLKLKLEIPGGLITTQDLPKCLTEKGINGQVADTLQAVVRRMEKVHYSGGLVRDEEVVQLSQEMAKALKEVDKTS